MLSQVVTCNARIRYPVGSWMWLWAKWLMIFLGGSLVALVLLLPFAIIVIVPLYLFAGWRLNRIILGQLALDPFQSAATVNRLLALKWDMIRGWIYRWPKLLIKIWLAQTL